MKLERIAVKIQAREELENGLAEHLVGLSLSGMGPPEQMRAEAEKAIKKYDEAVELVDQFLGET